MALNGNPSYTQGLRAANGDPFTPAPSGSPVGQQIQGATNFASASGALNQDQTQLQLNQLGQQFGLGQQGSANDLAYTNSQYGLQQGNLGQSLQNSLIQQIYRQAQIDLQRQGITAERGTAQRNFDYQKQQIDNSAAARGAYGAPGRQTQGTQLFAGLLDTLGNLNRQWQGTGISQDALGNQINATQQQNAFQKLMLALGHDYTLKNMGLSQQQLVQNFQNQSQQANLSGLQNALNLQGGIQQQLPSYAAGIGG
jgi:hypothetical protein